MPVAMERARVKVRTRQSIAQIEEERDLGGQPEIAHGIVDERGEPDARSAAGERDDEALGEQLSDDAAAARADGEPHGEFLAALGGAGEEEVGEIDAGEQEHEGADGGQKIPAKPKTPLRISGRNKPGLPSVRPRPAFSG